MSDVPLRMRLSSDQAAFLTEVVAGYPEPVRGAAARIARGEVVPGEDARWVGDALADEMMSVRGYTDADGWTDFGLRVDDIIGIVAQWSEDFFD